jgi:hypothetical protein
VWTFFVTAGDSNCFKLEKLSSSNSSCYITLIDFKIQKLRSWLGFCGRFRRRMRAVRDNNLQNVFFFRYLKKKRDSFPSKLTQEKTHQDIIWSYKLLRILFLLLFLFRGLVGWQSDWLWRVVWGADTVVVELCSSWASYALASCLVSGFCVKVGRTLWLFVGMVVGGQRWVEGGKEEGVIFESTI